MPLLTTHGARHYFRLEGLERQPTLVLAHALGLDHGMWDPQVHALLSRVRVLRYDLRGHGASEATRGDYTIAQLGRDVLGLGDALGIARFAFCGLSIGGMVGQWLGAHAADRLTHLVLACTSPRVADPPALETRRKTVLAEGMAATAEAAISRFFSPEFLATNPPAVATMRRTLLAIDPIGYAGCCAAVRDMDQRATMATIHVPTLVIGGDRDVSMPWNDHGGVLAHTIPHAREVRLPAAHVANLESPEPFTRALVNFLQES